MAFEGLKEQIKDNWADLSSKIQENSTFNNLREQFESQSPPIQRAIVTGVAILMALFLISFPWGYFSESQDNLESFNENRGLIQGLLRASRSTKEGSPLPAAEGPDVLRGRVDAIIKENRLVPDQVGEIQQLPDRPAQDLVPSVVTQAGLVVQLKNLNLNQIMAIAHQTQSLGPGTKLMGLDVVQAPGQTHYYNMIMRLVNFSLPPAGNSDALTAPEKEGRPRKRARQESEEESSE